MFLGWDRDFKRHQGKHAEQTVLSCVAGYQCQVRRGWLCFLLSVCVRMEDSKPVSQALSTVSMDIFKVDYGKISSHWVGQPKKMTRDRPGQEAFQDTWWGGGIFFTQFALYLLSIYWEDFLLWVGVWSRTYPTAPSMVPIKTILLQSQWVH